jgi:predicted nucleotidyltransferase
VKTLGDILTRKEDRLRALEQNIPHVIGQLKDLGAVKVILFGSLARRDVGPRSDLDLIAIMPPTQSGREWLRQIYAEIDRGMACDILAYTESELRETLATSRFLRHALSEGEVLYEA